MIDLKWRFNLSGHGQKKGINEAGIVGFSGNRIKSLTREIIQNSLDAKDPEISNSPVKIEFNTFFLPRDEFPDVENLEDALNSSLIEVSKLNDKTPKRFFENSLEIIKQDEIPFLRISDFNTIGLKGVQNIESSPWYNLVRSQGVSDKNSIDGGSFGIGKNAAFACSDLRTVIYSTKTIDNEKGTQGVTNLVSYFIGDDGDYTQGPGYLGINDRNEALLELISLDKDFSRTSPGTDIFVAGLYDLNNFDEEVIIAVLNNFLYAIYKNTLEIIVNNITINKETIKKNNYKV